MELKPVKRADDWDADDMASARRVLLLEAEGINALAESLGDDFARAIGLLLKVKGRIIVTGMGKSGHIARKIAATLASTGNPAFFVHPAEASHGDLGMITPEDAVIALSNSGETAEMADLVAFTRRFAISLVAITSRKESALGEAADVTLVLPKVKEACPMGLAPTTSTTMSLALGDALAVALLERKGFSASDFQLFHPGGKLGRRLLRVSDIMHKEEQIPLVEFTTPMTEVIIEMTAKRLGCAGVLKDGKLIGIITDGDLRRHLNDGLPNLQAGEIMTANPKTARPQILAGEALRIMNECAITSLFIVDEGEYLPVGILHVHDCLRAGVA